MLCRELETFFPTDTSTLKFISDNCKDATTRVLPFIPNYSNIVITENASDKSKRSVLIQKPRRIYTLSLRMVGTFKLLTILSI